MARTRNIKPSFFTNDILAECSPLARLIFAGLWTIADREGRLEDRPKKIKAEILPYDNCSVEELLNSLNDAGFIIRYALENNEYIQIVNFKKHQNPHQKENASTIPAPDKHRTSTRQDLNKPGLNPSSLSPIPQPLSLKPESEIKKETKNGKSSENKSERAAQATARAVTGYQFAPSKQPAGPKDAG